MVPSTIVEISVLLMVVGPTDWVRRAALFAGMLALRLIFLCVCETGGGAIFGFSCLRWIAGRLPTRFVKLPRSSSLFILVISVLSIYLSALKGDRLPLLLFTVRAPKPMPPPELSVVFDFVFMLVVVMAGFSVGIVLMTHK